MSFSGWPADGIAFLRELEENNDRDWFKQRRPRFEETLAEPARQLGAELTRFGRPKLFRPFNDVRFHQAPPIKEHVGLAVGYEGSGGFYVELSLDGLFLACGLHNPQPDQVTRLREAVADGRRSASLTRALASAQAGGLVLNEPDLKRAPRGYPADHPRAQLLLRKRLVVTRRDPVAKWMSTRAASKRIAERLEAGEPLVKWLRAHVGPSEKPAKRAGQ